jgi:excisionase family DNA binding protein
MRAHGWTRARQRSVRQISRPVGDLEEEESREATEPEPGLLTDEEEAEGLPQPEPEEPAEEAQLAVDEAPEPPEPEDEAPQAADEDWDEVEAAADEMVADEVVEEGLADESQAGPTEGLLTEPETQPSAPPPSPPKTRPRRRRGAPPEQAELPLGLEPVVEKPQRRSATETREDLIQRLLDPHLTLQETAKLLNVCPTTVRRYTNRGLLAHYRTPGNQRRFRLSDVLAFMERQGIPAQGLERKRSGLMGESGEPGEHVS